MYLYHFCAIWKLLDIKGRSIILGEPPFLGGNSHLPLLPRYRTSWQPEATLAGAGYTPRHAHSSFSLLLNSTKGLTVPENALRQPHTDHYHAESWQIPQSRGLPKSPKPPIKHRVEQKDLYGCSYGN